MHTPRQRLDQGELDQGNRRGGPRSGRRLVNLKRGKNRKAQGRRDAFMGWPMNGAAMRPRLAPITGRRYGRGFPWQTGGTGKNKQRNGTHATEATDRHGGQNFAVFAGYVH